MRLFKSMISAFLMYLKIPMPRIAWTAENRSYALCFFPLIGVLIGILLLLWRTLCAMLSLSPLLCGVGSVLVPILVTGGIHLDGFCDVNDARASYADREKQCAILSDPHIGAFAVIKLCMYLMLQAALMAELTKHAASIVALGFILSRSLSGLTAVTFRAAKKTGTLQAFVSPAHKKVTILSLISTAALVSIGMLCIRPALAIAALLGAGLSVGCYKRMAYRNFGGITGDTAGWFLQVCEMTLLISTVLTEKIMMGG